MKDQLSDEELASLFRDAIRPPQPSQHPVGFDRGAGSPRLRRVRPTHPSRKTAAVGYLSVSLERLQKRDEIGLLLRAQADLEAVVIELDHVGQRRRESVVEVRRARSKAAQNGSLEQ